MAPNLSRNSNHSVSVAASPVPAQALRAVSRHFQRLHLVAGLVDGGLPLDLLELKMDRWLKTQ
ncbi:MAG: hypothetical protein IIC57_01965 [Proteobacteria bacterium]|nr:hypothetical protein [Pseudomonadota bacterium]